MDVDSHVVPLHKRDLRVYMKEALVAAGIQEAVAIRMSGDVLDKFMGQFLAQLKLRGGARMRGWLSATKRVNSDSTFTLRVNVPEEKNDGRCELDDYTES